MNATVSVSAAPSAAKTPGALAIFMAHLSRWLPAAEREAALAPVPSIVVRIGENERGGFSIYAVSPEARTLFGGAGPCGNFATYADAWRRAHCDNCWSVAEPSETLDADTLRAAARE